MDEPPSLVNLACNPRDDRRCRHVSPKKARTKIEEFCQKNTDENLGGEKKSIGTKLPLWKEGSEPASLFGKLFYNVSAVAMPDTDSCQTALTFNVGKPLGDADCKSLLLDTFDKCKELPA